MRIGRNVVMLLSYCVVCVCFCARICVFACVCLREHTVDHSLPLLYFYLTQPSIPPSSLPLISHPLISFLFILPPHSTLLLTPPLPLDGTSQPSLNAFVAMMQGASNDTGINYLDLEVTRPSAPVCVCLCVFACL